MSQAELLPSAPCPFSFKNHEIRTIQEDNGALWFAAKDVCAALGVTWSGATLKGIPAQWQGMLNFNTPSGNQRLRALQEPGVYKLAFRSNKEEADEFTNWIASDVVPSIRRTGQYTAKPQAALTDAPITPDQQCTLQALVRALVEKGGIYAAIWSRFNNHFRLGSYKQLPQSRMSEAVDYLARFDAQTKALPEPEARSKQKALPSTHDPLREKIGQELSKVDFYIKEIAAAEDRVFQLLLEKWRNEHPGEIAHEDRVLVASGCATRHLWSSINASLEALRASVTARLGVGA